MKKFLRSVSCWMLVAMMGFSAACDYGNKSDGSSVGESVSSEQSSDQSSDQGGDQGGNQGGETNLAQYSLNETVQKLSGSVYADEGMTDDNRYGLSDISNVGVIESETYQELYPIELSGEYEIIEYSEMTGANDYEKLSAAFSAAKTLNNAGKKAIISLPEDGTLNVNASLSGDSDFAFRLNGYNGLYIKGNGCKILMSYNNFAFRGFLTIAESKDVHINDLVVDYEIPTAISGMISTIDTKNMTITLEVSEEFNETMKRVQENNGTVKSYVEFNEIGTCRGYS